MTKTIEQQEAEIARLQLELENAKTAALRGTPDSYKRSDWFPDNMNRHQSDFTGDCARAFYGLDLPMLEKVKALLDHVLAEKKRDNQ